MESPAHTIVDEAPELADADRRRAELCAGSALGPQGALALIEVHSKLELAPPQ